MFYKGKIAHFKGKIAHFRVPHDISFVDEITMTVIGKVERGAMREQMAGEHKANERQSHD